MSLQLFEFIRKEEGWGFLYFLFTHMVLFVSVTESGGAKITIIQAAALQMLTASCSNGPHYFLEPLACLARYRNDPIALPSLHLVKQVDNIICRMHNAVILICIKPD